jgi:glutathione S-transferase
MTQSAQHVLIGQFDSPFVRRVGIAMSIYGIAFEHRRWSVFRDAEMIAPYNPLRRVPTVIWPGGEVLVESAAILDALDDQVADAQLLLPRRGVERRAGLRVASLACGMADKGVALVYENVAREEGSQSTRWRRRCEQQLLETLAQLERERTLLTTRWWLGDELSHADIAVGVAVHFLVQAAPDVVSLSRFPALRDHEARCHALPPFQAINEPLNFPR